MMDYTGPIVWANRQDPKLPVSFFTSLESQDMFTNENETNSLGHGK